MTLGRDSDSGLEQQRAPVEAAFSAGWAPVSAGEPPVLTERAHAEARNVIGHWAALNGGWR